MENHLSDYVIPLQKIHFFYCPSEAAVNNFFEHRVREGYEPITEDLFGRFSPYACILEEAGYPYNNDLIRGTHLIELNQDLETDLKTFRKFIDGLTQDELDLKLEKVLWDFDAALEGTQEAEVIVKYDD